MQQRLVASPSSNRCRSTPCTATTCCCRLPAHLLQQGHLQAQLPRPGAAELRGNAGMNPALRCSCASSVWWWTVVRCSPVCSRGFAACCSCCCCYCWLVCCLYRAALGGRCWPLGACEPGRGGPRPTPTSCWGVQGTAAGGAFRT
jgi:hypothetical protein